MSAFIEPAGPGAEQTPTPNLPLDEAVWQAWIAKNRAQDQRSSAARFKAAAWVVSLALVAAAGIGIFGGGSHG